MNRRFKRETAVRAALALVILVSGLAMIPFVDLPKAIGWELLAGVYQPELAVNATNGAPGSVFAFTGTNYPPNSPATVYVDGQWRGEVTTDGSGQATFLLDTTGSQPGPYNVTLEVDVNASATQSITLVDGGTIVTPPANFPGPTFTLEFVRFLPVVAKI
jgi:hypothetical protein